MTRLDYEPKRRRWSPTPEGLMVIAIATVGIFVLMAATPFGRLFRDVVIAIWWSLRDVEI